VLLEVARLGDRRKMEDAIALVASGSTRDDLREQKKSGGAGKEKSRAFHFEFKPKDGPYKINIEFHKTRVNRDELIGAVREFLKQLESGNLQVAKKKSSPRA
jgi:hypothetical protein